MSIFCNRTRSYANLYRLQYCTRSDDQTVYDPAESCYRCKRCGERTIQCTSCMGRVHWMESPCPQCGADLTKRWGKGKTATPHAGAATATPGNGSRDAFNASLALPLPNSIEHVIVEFFRLLPYEAAKAAYRLAIQELHPDKGGDTTKAARLNAAWRRIKAEIFEP